MEFISSELDAYCRKFTKPEDPVLAALDRETHLKVLSPRMLSGHLQGKFLSMISALMKTERILEIGTYTGYSAIALARGLMPTGKLITIDPNPEIESIAKKHFEKAGLTDKIEFIQGDAMQIIPGLSGQFDLVFIDADKRNYINYYHLVKPLLRSGGLLIADNVLWSGKVLMEEKKMDADTSILHRFNRLVTEDTEMENMLLPIRDGLMMARKL